MSRGEQQFDEHGAMVYLKKKSNFNIFGTELHLVRLVIVLKNFINRPA